ncbi:MAG TPA: ABC transporter ATP-binding protein [Thermoleophilaceae bacterium]|nr:ABC transporter ATP-binding protein [Thermoleophilaceae bacterium]
MTRLKAHIHRLLVPDSEADQLVAAAPALGVREIFRRFWPDARPFRKQIAMGLLFLILVPAVEAAEIWMFKLVVDEALVPRELEPLAWIALAYLGLTVLSGLLSFGDDYLAAWVGEHFLLRLRARVFDHVQGLSLHALDRRRLGDLLSRLTSDIQAIESFMLAGIGDGVSALARIVFFGGALFYLNWQLALASLVVAPLFYVTARKFSRLVKHAAREKRRRSGSLSAVAEEGLANAALVQSLNRQGAESERFRSQNERIVDAELASTRIKGLFTPIVDLIELLGAMIVLGLGTWALTKGDLTLGGLLVFVAYLTQLYGPIRDLSRLSNSIFAAAAGAERVSELLDERASVTERPDARPLPCVSGRVEFDAVTFAYPGSARPALDDVRLVVEPGETVAVVGPSGAGKSTLARLLLRFDDPASGRILLDGTDLRHVTLVSLRDKVGLLLQETLLPDLTAAEAIAYGREGATKEQIEAAARAAGAHHFIVALPEGYDTRLGQRGRRLSGGQRQRIAVARALVRDTPVLVLDEPTTGLDSGAKAALLEPLRALTSARTTILISHDPEVIEHADRVVALRDGRLEGRATVPLEVPA